jgi:hypothetical protein
MSAAVYLLCALTALACGVLLLRGYFQNGARLLFWGGLCFVGLAASNSILFVDLIVIPEVDLYPLRNVTTVAAVGVLLYGLIWETE